MGIAARAPAALALAAYSGLAASESLRLFAVDTQGLITAAVLLGLGSLGLVARQLWAFVFGLVFLGLSGVAYSVTGAMAVHGAFTGEGGGSGGWEGVRAFLMGAAGAVALLAGVFSAALAACLLAGWRSATAARSLGVWIVSIAVATAAVGGVGFVVGHDYLYRRMATRHDCWSGQGTPCYVLANDKARFSPTERREFARRGCEAFFDGACRQLAEFLGASGLGSESPEARALAARCHAGQSERCLELGRYLLGTRARAYGARYLERACQVDARRCANAARAALAGGQGDLSRALLEQGCDREDTGSCTALLREAGPGLAPEDRLRLEMRACLVGDVNDCTPLIRRDLTSVCPVICEGVSEHRLQSCGHCAKQAGEQGQPALALQWLAANCEKGYRWSCTEFDRLRARSPSPDRPFRIS